MCNVKNVRGGATIVLQLGCPDIYLVLSLFSSHQFSGWLPERFGIV